MTADVNIPEIELFGCYLGQSLEMKKETVNILLKKKNATIPAGSFSLNINDPSLSAGALLKITFGLL